MQSSLAYTRKFIILKKDLGTVTERNPKGHGKIEMKGLRGVVTVSIEYGEEESFYNVVFISKDKSNPILNLGKIFTDNLGRGKGEYTFMQKDVVLENLKGILIMRNAEVLLGGYIDKEDGTIERYIESILKTPVIREEKKTVEETIEVPVEPVESVELVEPVEPAEPVEYAAEERFKEVFEDPYEPASEYVEEFAFEPEYETGLQQEQLNYEIAPELTDAEETDYEEVIDEIDVDIENEDEGMEPDYKTIDHIKKINQKNQTTNYVLSILRFFPYVDPFKYNLKGYNWWIVELDKENEYKSFLPYFSYLAGGNNKEPYASDITTCNQLMNKYQHYLFGLYNENEEVKYFVYGVPGSFTQGEHPNGGANGFSTWYQGENTEGYWIIYINPMTGKAVNPLNPMNPTD